MHNRTIKLIGVIFALTMFVLAFVTTVPIARAKNPNAAPNVTANWVTTGNKTGSGDFLGTLNTKPLIFKTNKVERMRLDALGNVGIGTNAPSSKLTVTGVIESTSGGIKFPDGTTQTTASVAGPNGWGLGGNAGTNPATNFLGTTDAQALVFKTNNSERARIDSSGKVGIGTNTPSEALTVQTATANYGFVQTDGTITVGSWIGTGGGSPAGGWYGTKSNHPLHFFVNNGSPSMTIKSDGTVGIGTTNPMARLDIISGDTSIFRVRRNDGTTMLTARYDGVSVMMDTHGGTAHVCTAAGGVTSPCAVPPPSMCRRLTMAMVFPKPLTS